MKNLYNNKKYQKKIKQLKNELLLLIKKYDDNDALEIINQGT